MHEAKTHLSRLLEAAWAGESIIVAKGRFRDAGSSAPPKPQELGFLPLHVPPDFFRPLPAEELDAWDR